MQTIQTTNELSTPTKLALDAVKIDSPLFLKTALSMGADISHINEYGSNLLLLATKTKKKETALHLSTHEYFQNSAIINQQNTMGETTLMCACYHGYKEVVQNILKIKNTNLDLQGTYSHSALCYAREGKQYDIVTLLIEHGANPTLRNNHGATIAFFEIISTSSDFSPSTVEKIMLAKDYQGNTQLHILTTSLIGKMAKCAKLSINTLFQQLLERFIRHKMSIWSTNNYGMLPLETAYEKYHELWQQYKTNKLSYLKKLLNNQEEMLHLLLLHYVKNIQKKPIIISSAYAGQLNVETVMAEKYSNNRPYYTDYNIDFKDKLKNELDNIPIIWISNPPTYSYTPAYIIHDASLPINKYGS